ncbi:hypothetical protein B0F90DRAFT_1743572 [Multifurca ochricompacta]|uniref:Cyanovirin-N domain-containing protein n=1 Tax=Multifurca ochricompacta TaxID=376703 RepID=A0AAD4M241_9AGAM|nr:hypothetical protein B0F90DRAFT_1743572 [Multifurca ochricompacta]
MTSRLIRRFFSTIIHMSLRDSCTSFGFSRPLTLWANCKLPSGETRYSTLDLLHCLRIDREIRPTDVAPVGFGNGEDSEWMRNLRMEGTVLKASVKWRTGWLFWWKEEWKETELDIDPYVRNNKGVLEFVLHAPEPSGFWNWLIDHAPKFPGLGGPGITIIIDADRKRQEEEYQKREEVRLRNTYREGEYRVWKGT